MDNLEIKIDSKKVAEIMSGGKLISEDDFNKKIDSQNVRITGYLLNIFISMITALIIVYLSK